MYSQEKQIAILRQPVANTLLNKLRKSLLSIAGATEEKAAWRLLDIAHDTALKGLLSSDLESLEESTETQVSIKTIFDFVKYVTPPVPALQGALVESGIPYVVAQKLLRYVDFLNFKHHVAALVMMYLLLYKFR